MRLIASGIAAVVSGGSLGVGGRADVDRSIDPADEERCLARLLARSLRSRVPRSIH